MDDWLVALSHFDARAVFVLGPDNSEDGAPDRRMLVAVHPPAYREQAEALARAETYGERWRKSNASLVAWRNLSGPQLNGEQVWIDLWLAKGAASLVRVEVPLPYGRAFECFTMLGRELQERAQAAEVVYATMSAWPLVKSEVMSGRFAINEREISMLKVLANGATAKEAALELDCSERYVTFMLTNVMIKLGGATNKAQAIQRACSLGLI